MTPFPLLPLGQVVLGIGLLTVGAEALVRGAAGLAEHLGLSPLVIGLTVVAFGTSMPEMAVSLGSAWISDGGVALGNALGSNIFNVLVVLGGAAVIRPLVADRQLVRLDVPVMIGTSVLVLLLALDGRLGPLDGLLLVALGITYTVVVVRGGRALNGEAVAPAEPRPEERHEHALATGGTTTLPIQLGWIVVGLLFLVVGARLVVLGASTVAHALGVSDLVIGLTVVAAGTSLPELATSFVAAVRGQRDIAVGNVVGSNVFNSLFVLGLAALAETGGLPVPEGVRTFDLPVMVVVSTVCLPIFFTGWAVSRREGIVFLAYYGAYLLYLALYHMHHAGEELVGTALLFFALPLTALTLGVGVFRQIRSKAKPTTDP
ncbi:MAG: calcium/sodium antiporter [Gemmatimonadetes bacterium]|nr:calcium/sodium antiporter [Gemmatimonadota bacterium]